MIAYQNIYVHGVTISAGLIPMIADGVAPETCKTVYIDNSGVPHECMTVYLYDDAVCYITDTIRTAPETTYNFSGTCAPGSRTVYMCNLADAQGETYKQMLTSSIITSAEADADGAFSFTDIQGVDGELTVWIEVTPDYINTAYVSFDVESMQVDPDAPTKENLVYTTFDPLDDSSKCQDCNGAGYIENSTCPECYGSGELDCDECSGYGYKSVVCATCGGDGSTVPCDACETTGSDPETGEVCPECGGAGTIDDICPDCDGDGSIRDEDSVCPVCNGEGALTCETCGGTGYEKCGSCSGTGTDENSEYGYMAHISGNCPNDAETIWISAVADTDGEYTEDQLVESVVYSCSPNSSTYEAFGDFFDTSVKYVVWCYTDTAEEITAETELVLENPNDPDCLSGDTLILMADGSLKQMQDIVEGDHVVSQNGEAVSVQRVARGHYNSSHTLYYFEDGTVIDETHEHRFYNVDQGFWQRLKHWRVGDHAVTQEGKHVAFVGSKHMDEPAEMFGIWTEDGTYFANGLMSGAAFCNKPLLEHASAEKAIDMVLSADEEKILKLMGLERLMV